LLVLFYFLRFQMQSHAFLASLPCSETKFHYKTRVFFVVKCRWLKSLFKYKLSSRRMTVINVIKSVFSDLIIVPWSICFTDLSCLASVLHQLHHHPLLTVLTNTEQVEYTT
jgi:hypothetical protein